ncbi:MAG: HDOD domain-containing protein [Spirochaetales bacterium]|jgi:putative nucleotidyltransferase with HDIG domain|nr:HDOD domain-containing protein [Spirochaetales bacterium]
MTDKSTEISEIIKRFKLLSPSASSLLAITTREDHNLSEIVGIIKCDANLTAKVLKIVNSAAYGLRNEITAIDRAINFMGESSLISIAMNEAGDMLYQKNLTGYEGEKGDLWRHNLLTGLAAKKIAPYAKDPINDDVAFTCGLLHDLGKSIISDFLIGTSGKVVQALENKKVADYQSAEQKILGIDHCDAGFELATYWHLPEPIPSAIRYHHHPAQAAPEYKTLVYTVHLGDMLAMMAGRGTGADTLQYKLDSNYSDYIELTENDLAGIMVEIGDEFTIMQESMQ